MGERRWTRRFKNPDGDWRDLSFHTDSEVLAILLPDVDWEALDDAMGDVSGGLGLSGDQMDLLLSLARRLLALYDGRDGE